MTTLTIVLIVFLIPVTVYITVRFGAAAWFKTKLEYMKILSGKTKEEKQ